MIANNVRRELVTDNLLCKFPLPRLSRWRSSSGFRPCAVQTCTAHPWTSRLQIAFLRHINNTHIGCYLYGGEKGIWTLEDVTALPLFESGQFNHSCISPYLIYFNRFELGKISPVNWLLRSFAKKYEHFFVSFATPNLFCFAKVRFVSCWVRQIKNPTRGGVVNLVNSARFEPATFSSASWRSIQLSYESKNVAPHMWNT